MREVKVMKELKVMRELKVMKELKVMREVKEKSLLINTEPYVVEKKDNDVSNDIDTNPNSSSLSSKNIKITL